MHQTVDHYFSDHTMRHVCVVGRGPDEEGGSWLHAQRPSGLPVHLPHQPGYRGALLRTSAAGQPREGEAKWINAR